MCAIMANGQCIRPKTKYSGLRCAVSRLIIFCAPNNYLVSSNQRKQIYSIFVCELSDYKIVDALFVSQTVGTLLYPQYLTDFYFCHSMQCTVESNVSNDVHINDVTVLHSSNLSIYTMSVWTMCDTWW